MNESIKHAKAEHERTSKILADAIKEAFPIGSTISVVMQQGRRPVIGTVTGHFRNYVHFKNTNTGLDRRFSATYDGHKAGVITP